MSILTAGKILPRSKFCLGVSNWLGDFVSDKIKSRVKSNSLYGMRSQRGLGNIDHGQLMANV